MIKFKEHSSLKYTYVRSIFHWSRFWANSLDLETLLTTCVRWMDSEILNMDRQRPICLHFFLPELATCPLNRNDVFRIGQRVRPIFLNSGHLIGSGDTYVSSNQIHLLFGTFGPKLGQKGLKMGLKCLGLVWYGLACDPRMIQTEFETKFEYIHPIQTNWYKLI